MALKRKSSSDSESVSQYVIGITLVESEPAIWRKLRLPGTVNLGYLHSVIQIAMGWTNSHLHHFIAGKSFYTDLGLLEGEECEPESYDEYETVLSQVAPDKRSKILYEYDFGDGWMHEIVVEQIVEGGCLKNEPAVCLDGENPCPPEDCGGIHGYYDMLEILKNPGHEEYEETKEWYDSMPGPKRFNLTETNKYLKMIKSVSPSVDQLGRILMKRDGD